VGTEVRPAFYALRTGGWRDYVTVLHLPYTAWSLSYVALGAALAPHFHTGRLVWTLAAFALALGVAAHMLDELHGRPLRTEIPAAVLVALAVASLAAACAIGVWASFAWDEPALLALVAVGGLVTPAYNLEWFGGVLHNAWGFALSWGAFPVLTAYFAQAGTIRAAAVAAAAFATAMTVAQRTLGTTESVQALERSLRILTAANVLLGCALVLARLT
jgi:hypothetical protein